jgi:DNA-binding transcriptional LysR family regulator
MCKNAGMDLQLLETFARVVEAGSLSRAARQLGCSLSTVSRQLAALEAELGAALVDRSTRALHMTPEGQRLRPHALAVLRAMDDARDSVARPGGLAGRVRLSVPVALGVTRVVPVLPALMARHERLQLELQLDNRRITLASEGVDVVVRTGPSPLADSSDLVASSLGRYRFRVCAAPALLARHGEPGHPAQLERAPLLGFRGIERLPFRRGAEAVAVAVDAAAFAANDALALLAAARGGLGFAALPAWLVDDAVARGELQVVLAGWSLPEGEAFVAHRQKGRGQRAVRAVVEHLRASLRFAPE